MAFANIRKSRKLKDELSKLVVEEEKIPPQLLWKIVEEEESLRPVALLAFLDYPRLSLADVFYVAERIPPELSEQETKELEDNLYRKAKELGLLIGDSDYVYSIIHGPLVFRPKVWGELVEKITNGFTNKARARRILKCLIDEDSQLRIPCIELFLKLEAPHIELKELLDSKWMYSSPILAVWARKVEIKARLAYEEEKRRHQIEAPIVEKVTTLLKSLKDAGYKKGLE